MLEHGGAGGWHNNGQSEFLTVGTLVIRMYHAI